MTDLVERITQVRSRVGPRWTAARERAVLFQIERRSERRRLAIRALLAVTAALVVVMLGRTAYLELGRHEVARVAPKAPSEGGDLLGLRDGTQVTALQSGTRIEAVELNESAVTVQLALGAAHFDVAHREGRVFRVKARDVTVTVLGTAFTVELLPAAVRVRVERGRVDVSWPAGHRQLVPGEEVVAEHDQAKIERRDANPVSASPASDSEHPQLEAPALDAPNEAPVIEAPSAPQTSPAPARIPTQQPSWRTLAQEGDYAGAFNKMNGEGAVVRDEPGDLLFAADVARLSGHPALAVPHLEQVLRLHASDSRAPLAAFTLGRTLLDALGRPREAAEAFARARKLSPSGALAQDALAREVESWYRAGESALAHERALEYLRRFPGGRRERAVRKQGGIDAPDEQN